MSLRSVNLVKASTLNSWLFSQLCLQMHQTKLCYFTLKMAAHGRVFKHAFELRDELKTVCNQKARSQFKALFNNKSELQEIVYLVDIFAIMNELNLYC